MEFFVEETEDGQKIYDTLLVKNPRALSILNNNLTRMILEELGKEPMCSMDIARSLKQHEQKIYYHMRKLEKLGIIKLEKIENRVGASAKIYSTISPVVSFKLFDKESYTDIKSRAAELKFLKPFVQDGQFNSVLIVGSPDPHGKYQSQASDGYCGINIAMFLGQFITDGRAPYYVLDTQAKEHDLKKNIILIGGPKSNIISEKINDQLPIHFIYSEKLLDWSIVSTISKNIYREKYNGIVCRIKSPFAEGKEILIMAGKGFTGSSAAVFAVIKHPKEILKGNEFDTNIQAKVVRGVDTNSDGIIDDVEFLE